MKNEKWKVKSEKWKVKSEKWKVKSKRWKVKNKKWKIKNWKLLNEKYLYGGNCFFLQTKQTSKKK